MRAVTALRSAWAGLAPWQRRELAAYPPVALAFCAIFSLTWIALP